MEGDHIGFSNQIDEPVLDEVMEKLMKISYFTKGDDDKPEEFTFHPALQATAKQFSEAMQRMIDFVKKSAS